MRRVILQPAGNKDAKKHFVDTISNPVPINKISPYIEKKEFDYLSKIYKNDQGAYVWGVTPGSNLTNKKKWDKINPKDIALFSKDGHIFSSGEVTYKLHNKNLALNLWKTDLNGFTWEYIFFLSNIKNHKIPYIDFNRSVGYSDNFVIQGFSVLDEQKSLKVLNSFDFNVNNDSPLGTLFSNNSTIDNKLKFKKWLDKQYGDTGTPSSYLKAVEILNAKLNTQLFTITDLQYLRDLFEDLIINQRNPDGKYFHSKSPSYGNKGFYSAAIKSYINFLENSLITTQINNNEKILFIDTEKNHYNLKISIQTKGKKSPEYKLTWKNDFKEFLNKLESKEHLDRAIAMGKEFPLYFLNIEKKDDKYFVTKRIHSTEYWNTNEQIQFKLGTKGTWGYWNKKKVALKLRPEIRNNNSVAIPSTQKNADKLLSFFKTIQKSDNSSYTDTIKDIIKLEDTDKITISKSRKEQSYLRDFLFKNKKTEQCGICNNELPIDLLWCSHIKKRSECSYEERIDYKNIVMPMCKFGCDELYERGYIYAVDRIVKINPKMKTTKDLRGKLIQISGNKIESKYYNEKTINYFKYHEKKHT